MMTQKINLESTIEGLKHKEYSSTIKSDVVDCFLNYLKPSMTGIEIMRAIEDATLEFVESRQAIISYEKGRLYFERVILKYFPDDAKASFDQSEAYRFKIKAITGWD